MPLFSFQGSRFKQSLAATAADHRPDAARAAATKTDASQSAGRILRRTEIEIVSNGADRFHVPGRQLRRAPFRHLGRAICAVDNRIAGLGSCSTGHGDRDQRGDQRLSRRTALTVGFARYHFLICIITSSALSFGLSRQRSTKASVCCCSLSILNFDEPDLPSR